MKTITFYTPLGVFRHNAKDIYVPDVGEEVKLTSGMEGENSGDNTYFVSKRKFTYSIERENIASHVVIYLDHDK